MTKYVVTRLIQAPMVILLLVTLSFFLMRLAPGGPFSNDRRLNPEVEAALQAKYKMDLPLAKQYLHFLKDLAHGNLGPSFRHKNKTVNEIILRTLPISLVVGGLALFLALVSGISAGVISSINHTSFSDYSLTSLSILGISLPTFVIGPFLQLVFSIKWNLLPIAGFEGMRSPSYLILPAITLAIPFGARISRLMRAGMLEILTKDFIQTARAKGMPSYVVIVRHAFPGAVLPVISYLGPAFASISTGSLVVEKIFQIPGLGREFIEGALNRDYTLVMGTVIVYGVMIITFNLIADITYALLDPRVRYE